MDISVKVTYRNDKLKSTREAAELSQSQVAEKTGISIRMIQNYEQGVKDLNGAKLATILKLCAALQCKIADILTDTETIELLADHEAILSLRDTAVFCKEHRKTGEHRSKQGRSFELQCVCPWRDENKCKINGLPQDWRV